MRNGIFQSFHSSLTSFGATEIQMSNPYFAPELDRSNSYTTALLQDLQASDDLHQCLTPLSTNPNFSWAADSSYLSGEGNESFPTFLYDNPSNESISARNLHDHDVTGNSKKRTGCSDENEKESRFNVSKRRKILNSEDHHLQASQLKAPVKRSQKLGDKVTALQKLVSPFGKTDTASVLQEATVYIKFLQEQIQVLSTPYFRYRSSMYPQTENEDRINLRSRGLCLVPVSTTVNLTKETGTGHSSSSGKNNGFRL